MYVPSKKCFSTRPPTKMMPQGQIQVIKISGYPDFPDFSKGYPDFSKSYPDFSKSYPEFSNVYPDFSKGYSNFSRNFPVLIILTASKFVSVFL